MKFMVMCTLVVESGSLADVSISKGMARMGLLPVGFSRSGERLAVGLDDAFVGEFRATDAQVLESMLRAQISELLGDARSQAGIRLCVLPMRAAIEHRRRA